MRWASNRGIREATTCGLYLHARTVGFNDSEDLPKMILIVRCE